MEWDRRTFLGGSIVAAATYPLSPIFGKPAREATGITVNFEDAGGSTLNSGDNNRRVYLKAVRYLNNRGGGTLIIPPKIYRFDGVAGYTASNVLVSGYGATFIGAGCRIVVGVESDGYDIHGLSLIENTGKPGAYVFDCFGSNCHFKEIHLERNPPVDGAIGYCRPETSGNLFENIYFTGSQGFFLAGHDHQIRGGSADGGASSGLFGTDDCWALKAIGAACYNIRISGFTARNFAALVSIGSQVGTPDADDPTHSGVVRNVVVENCVAEACPYFAYVKPGVIESNDYRDGLVEDVQINNCRHVDLTGERFRNSIMVKAGRGAIVRRLSVNGLAITARGGSPLIQNVGAIYLLALKSTNGAGTGASIDDIRVSGVTCVDPFGGAPTSASTPGLPIYKPITIEKQDPNIGHVGSVAFDNVSCDGCAQTAVFIGPQIHGPISLESCSFNGYAAAVTRAIDKGSVVARSPISLSNFVAVPSPDAPPDTRGVMPDAAPDKTVPYVGDVLEVSLPSLAAGVPVTSPIFTADRDTWVSRVDISVREAIPATNGPGVRFTLRNASNGETLASATTSGGLLSQPGIQSSLNGDIQFSGVAASIPKGEQLLLEITHEQGGADVIDPSIAIHCVPYGVA